MQIDEEIDVICIERLIYFKCKSFNFHCMELFKKFKKKVKRNTISFISFDIFLW